MVECYWLKFSADPSRQCKAPGIFYRVPVGNATDAWTWCEQHVGPQRDTSRTTDNPEANAK